MLTAITVTLPERARSFAQLAESIARQTLPPSAWLVEWDFARRGTVAVFNGLAARADTDWLFRIDDTDILERDHFDTMRSYLTDDADIVYTWSRVEGALITTQFQQPFDPDKLRRGNYIPAAIAIRRTLWQGLGGYRDTGTHEDHDLLLRALDAGANFVCVPIETWRYRLTPTEYSLSRR